MVKTVAFAKAKNHLSGLVRDVESGDQIVITKDRLPVARLLSEAEFQRMTRQLAVDDLLRLRTEWLAAGITGEGLFEASRKDLEERP